MKKLSLALLVIATTIFAVSLQPANAFDERCSQYGLMATYDYLTNSCKCMSGYVFGEDLLGNTTCISKSSYCSDKYGFLATYDILSDSCACMSGYEFDYDILGNMTCVSGLSLCRKKHGLHVDYNSYNHTCECDDDYTFDDNNQCVEKQHNVYFKLIELDTYNKTAIIKSEYDYKYYLITYGLGCYSSSFKRYINGDIVVNLGTDYYVDKYDYIVLQNDNETCDIRSVAKVDSTYTLGEEADEPSGTISPELAEALIKYYATQNANQCGENSHVTTDNKCQCDSGYQWASEAETDLDCVAINNATQTTTSSTNTTQSFSQSSNDVGLSGLYNYYKIRKEIGCRNRTEHDARCFWNKVDLVYAKEKLGKSDIADQITTEDIQWIEKKIGFLETRYSQFCENSNQPANFCSALNKLIERGRYFLSR